MEEAEARRRGNVALATEDKEFWAEKGLWVQSSVGGHGNWLQRTRCRGLDAEGRVLGFGTGSREPGVGQRGEGAERS